MISCVPGRLVRMSRATSRERALGSVVISWIVMTGKEYEDAAVAVPNIQTQPTDSLLASMPPRNPSTPKTAPDSPRLSQSPLPAGIHGDLELELLGLANALYNLGTTVINDSTKEKQKTGAGAGDATAGKPVGQRVNGVIGHLRVLDDMAAGIPTMIPMQVLQ